MIKEPSANPRHSDARQAASRLFAADFTARFSSNQLTPLMEYIKPETVLSPRGAIEDLEVVYDGGEHSWSLAKMKWDGEPVVAMRWNGGRENKIPPSEV